MCTNPSPPPERTLPEVDAPAGPGMVEHNSLLRSLPASSPNKSNTNPPWPILTPLSATKQSFVLIAVALSVKYGCLAEAIDVEFAVRTAEYRSIHAECVVYTVLVLECRHESIRVAVVGKYGQRVGHRLAHVVEWLSVIGVRHPKEAVEWLLE
jgi:hypothetical protein